MTPTSTPTGSETITLLTVCTLLAEQYGTLTAIKDPHAQPPLELTYKELFERIQAFAGGLQALGVQPGDKVALIADNSPRWLMADLGSLFAGAVDVPRSAIADPQELGYIIQNTGCTTLIIEDLKTYDRIRSFAQQQGIERVILLSDESREGCLSLSDLLAKGREAGFKPPQLTRSQLATIIHTSGTGGKPKGVMLSHGNIMHQVEHTEDVIQPQAGMKSLAILPTWHSYERSCEYFLLSKALTMIYTDARHLKTDLQEEKPHFLIAVPRIWESVYEGIQKKMKGQSPLLRRLVQTLISISERYVICSRIANQRSIRHLNTSSSQRALARVGQILLFPLHKLGDLLAYRKIRQAVGSNFQHAINGGGALPSHLDTFFEIVGISILNGYGLTETSPILAARRPHHNVRGTVGPPLPHTQIQIVDLETRKPLPQGQVGLICAQGPQVMQGYYNNPEATVKVLSDGWFNTGDLGWLTPDHHLVITGRAKDTIVLSNGENIEPQPLEDVCVRSPYIDQIMIVGQDQKQLGALIHPNKEELMEWAESQGLPEANSETALLASQTVRALILSELKQQVRNRPGYRSDDAITDFRFVPEPFTPENGLLTQTLKIRRLQVAERYQHLIHEIYSD